MVKKTIEEQLGDFYKEIRGFVNEGDKKLQTQIDDIKNNPLNLTNLTQISPPGEDKVYVTISWMAGGQNNPEDLRIVSNEIRDIMIKYNIGGITAIRNKPIEQV